jgi:hypothetical protein
VDGVFPKMSDRELRSRTGLSNSDVTPVTPVKQNDTHKLSIFPTPESNSSK